LPSDGGTWWSADGTPHARLETAERFRPDAGVEIHRLAASGLDVRILSGDAPERVAAAARRLGLPEERAEGGLSPEQKAAIVRGLDHGDTLFIGDGLNDGPAFDAAACAGTPAVDHAALPGRADFYFLGGGLGAVRFTLDAARTLRSVQRTNLVISTAYNAVALVLCFAGLVHPAMAAVLMPASSLAVVSLTLARLSEAHTPWK
jgi:Cu2+-exporting ATPase